MKAKKTTSRKKNRGPSDREKHLEALTELRRDVLSALATIERQPFTGLPEEERREEELAADDAIMEVEHRYHQSLVERLRGIEEAFERLNAGSYGRCRACGAEISKKRLEADPSVALCLVCQELAERQEVAAPVAVI